MVMPALDDPGKNRRHVDLTKLDKILVVAAQDFHEATPFVGNDLELLHFVPINKLHPITPVPLRMQGSRLSSG